SSSGIHAITGLAWQLEGKPQIQEAVEKLKKTYTEKAAIYLRNLEGALQELGRCEAEHYGEEDWYQRYGWVYHNFMKAKYQSAPPRLHRLGGLVGLEGAGQQGFDLALHGLGRGRVGELHADAGSAVALGTGGGDPDHLAGHRQAILLLHQGQQDEDFVADGVA